MSSITDPSTGSIVKSDRIGRTRCTRHYKQQVLAAFESSSLSAPSFAAQCGIKPHLRGVDHGGLALHSQSRRRLSHLPHRRGGKCCRWKLARSPSARWGRCQGDRLQPSAPHRRTPSPPFLKPDAMLSFNGNFKVHVAIEPCDMRKNFNTLSVLVRNHLKLDPLSGAAFLFTNKSRRLIKILYFDGTGYRLVTKRLEKGTQPSTLNFFLVSTADGRGFTQMGRGIRSRCGLRHGGLDNVS